jgi:hypothetical protein
MNTTVSESIESIIIDTVKTKLEQRTVPDTDYIATDNLAEIIEKLTILHIRTWMLEDAIQVAKTDSDIALLKKKIDICFKVKRPKFVEAINLMVENAIMTGRSLKEDSVKLYKGV